MSGGGEEGGSGGGRVFPFVYKGGKVRLALAGGGGGDVAGLKEVHAVVFLVDSAAAGEVLAPAFDSGVRRVLKDRLSKGANMAFCFTRARLNNFRPGSK